MGRVYQSRTVRSVLRDLTEQQRKQGSASVMARSGLSVPGEGVTQVDGDLVVLGDFTAQRKINAEALVNLVAADYLYTDGSGFAFDTVGTTPKMSMTVTVPAGFTTAVVYVTSRVYGINSTAGVDYLFSRTRINGVYGDSVPYPATGSGGSTVSLDPSSWKIDGLAGGDTFVIDVQAWTAFANWGANAANRGNVNGIVNWYR